MCVYAVFKQRITTSIWFHAAHTVGPVGQVSGSASLVQYKAQVHLLTSLLQLCKAKVLFYLILWRQTLRKLNGYKIKTQCDTVVLMDCGAAPLSLMDSDCVLFGVSLGIEAVWTFALQTNLISSTYDISLSSWSVLKWSSSRSRSSSDTAVRGWYQYNQIKRSVTPDDMVHHFLSWQTVKAEI